MPTVANKDRKYRSRKDVYEALLVKHKLTGRSLARLLNTPSPALHESMRNCKPVTYSRALLLCVFFGVKLGELFEDVTLQYRWEKMRPMFKFILTQTERLNTAFMVWEYSRLYNEFFKLVRAIKGDDQKIIMDDEGGLEIDGVLYDHHGSPGLGVTGYIRLPMHKGNLNPKYKHRILFPPTTGVCPR